MPESPDLHDPSAADSAPASGEAGAAPQDAGFHSGQYEVPLAPIVRDGRRERRRLSLLVGAAAAFVLLALGSAILLSAPSGTASVLAAGAPGSTAAPLPAAPTAVAGLRSQACQDMLSNLASRLGVSVQTLQQALAGAAGDTIDQLVRQGRLTASQATSLKAALSRIGSSPCATAGQFGARPFGAGAPFPGGSGPGAMRMGAMAIVDTAASALKLDRAALLADLRQGKDLEAIARQQGVDYATVTAAIHGALKTRLDALVQQGTITSAQETDILAAADRQLAGGSLPIFERRPGAAGSGPGMRGGFGMPGGGFGGPGAVAPTAPSAPPSPAASPAPVAPANQG